MRKKALLVGAQASFEGPWVNLEEGNWLVEPPLGVGIMYSNGRSSEVCDLFPRIRLVGPIRIRAKVLESYTGPDVFLSIEERSDG